MVDKTIAMADVATMEDRMGSALAAQRFRAILIGALAALALALSSLGIYSVVAYTVAQRTREIGIRMALGDSASHVRRQVVLGALGVSAVGALAGAAISLGVGRWISSFLFEVQPGDGRALGATVATMLVIAAVAAYGPARRASKVDPVKVLRNE